MKTYFHGRIASFISRTAFAALAMLVLSLNVHGQGGGLRTVRDMSRTEQTRGAEVEPRQPLRDANTIMAEVNEDFERLRIINEGFKTALSATTTFSFKSLSDDATEIKKRGNRLRGNLAALPKPEKDERLAKEPTPADEAEMRSLLMSVNTVMTSFLNNPVFSDMGTLDSRLAAKARRDLDTLIAMSDVLKNGAEKLSKRKH
ncbi:MAG TPA: hypothetical protein VIU65_03645 [Pyrinomonadaceae bacterium]